MNAVVGLMGMASIEVAANDTAVAMGSGSVPVLATPRLIALCEQATCVALDGHLASGSTTVGVHIELDHLRPTPIGVAVTAEAVLERVDGRRLTFAVSAKDAAGTIAAGTVTRVLVDLERFLEQAH